MERRNEKVLEEVRRRVVEDDLDGARTKARAIPEGSVYRAESLRLVAR